MEPWKQKVLTSRLLFTHAEVHGSSLSQLDRLQAVIGYGSSMETLLKGIADRLTVQPDSKYFTIFDLIEKVDKEAKKRSQSLHHKGEALAVAEDRNLAIHEGTAPARETVERDHWLASQFMKDNTTEFFGLDFDTLDMSDFIKSQIARQLLGFAKDNLEAETFFHSIAPARFAFDIFFENYFALLPTSIRFRSFDPKGWLMLEEGQDPTPVEAKIVEMIREFQRSVATEIGEVKAYLGLSSLGYSMSQINRFDKIRDAMRFNFGPYMFVRSSAQGGFGENTPVQQETSKWFREFIIDVILRMEEIGVNDEIPNDMRDALAKMVELKGKVYT